MSEEVKKKMSGKKLATIIGVSVLAVGAIATTYWAVIEYGLRDLENMSYLTFKYSYSNTNPNHVPEVTITGLNGNNLQKENYPRHFRVPEKLLGYKVTAIDNHAFAGLEKLKSVTLPSTITSIGDGAFANCPELVKVKLDSKNLTHIGEGIFEESDKWEGNSQTGIVMFGSLLYSYNGTLAAGTTIKSIDDKVAGEDESKFIYINNDVTLIASGAFANQNNLVAFNLPERFKSISNALVRNCPNLTSFVAPGATEIGSSAFEGCSSLSSFDFTKITSIGEAAFKNTAITDVSLNDSIDALAASTFADCHELSNIRLPKALTRIGDYTFANCTNLKSINSGTINNASFTNEIDDIDFIGAGAFQESGLEEITLPQKLTVISEDTFKDCESLASVILPEVSKKTGEDEVDLYGHYAYNGLQTISNNAFENTKSLETLAIPYLKGDFAIKNLGSSDSLFTDVLINTLYSIGDNVFAGSGLKEFTVPASIDIIGKSLFKDCHDLATVNFQDPTHSVTVGLYTAVQVVDEGRLKEIKSSAFENTPVLQALALPNTITAIQSSAFKNSGIVELTLPVNTGFNTINENTFTGCDNLETIVIPAYVNTIKMRAFENCGLVEITIPVTVTKMGMNVFYGDSGLKVNLDFTENEYNQFLANGGNGWMAAWNVIDSNNTTLVPTFLK